MIAEIKGKISNTGSNLNDRLEDNLTGNVFGTLRYISFEKGLKKILIESISPKNSKAIDIIKNINVEEWKNKRILYKTENGQFNYTTVGDYEGWKSFVINHKLEEWSYVDDLYYK